MKVKVQRISEKDYKKIFIMTEENSHMKCIENILICRMKDIK